MQRDEERLERLLGAGDEDRFLIGFRISRGGSEEEKRRPEQRRTKYESPEPSFSGNHACSY